jgi:hypothetical protein
MFPFGAAGLLSAWNAKLLECNSDNAFQKDTNDFSVFFLNLKYLKIPRDGGTRTYTH